MPRPKRNKKTEKKLLRVFRHLVRKSGDGEVAEWSKAAALGAALFGGVGSNPILVNFLEIDVFHCPHWNKTIRNFDF